MISDTTLAVALIGVFVLDRIQWLRHGEALLEIAGDAPRVLAFGSNLELARRRPWLAGLWPPDSVGFRLTWTVAPQLQTANAIAALAPRAAALRLPGWLCGAAQLLTLAIGPLALLAGSSAGFLLAIACAWLLTLVIGLVGWRRRARLNLSTAAIGGTTLVALVCLPCSGNLARAWAAASGRAPVSLPEAVATLPAPLQAGAADGARRALEVERQAVGDDAAALTEVADALARLPAGAP